MLPILLTVLSPYTALLAAIIMTVRVFQKNYPIIKNPWNTGILLMFTWSLFVGIYNKSIPSTVAALVLLLFFFVGIYVQNTLYEKKAIEKLLHNILVLSIIPSFVGIIEKISAECFHSLKLGYLLGLPSYVTEWRSYRIYGTFLNSNIAGDWFAVMALVGIYFFYKSSGREKLFYTASIFLSIISLNLTGSRGAGVSILVGLLAFAFLLKLYDKKRNIWFIASVFCITAITMFIIPELTPVTSNINTSMNHEFSRSLVTRQSIWESSFKMFKLKPVTGYGLLGIYFSDFEVFKLTREPHAHNLWLSFAVTLGTIGLLIYLYMRKYVYESLIVIFKHKCEFVPLLFSVQALILTHGLVDFTIMTPQIGMIYITSTAIICALSKQYSPYSANNRGYLLIPAGKRGFQLK